MAKKKKKVPPRNSQVLGAVLAHKGGFMRHRTERRAKDARTRKRDFGEGE